MLSSISHDLRTPLAALRVSVEAIRDGLADDPDAYLKGMEHQIGALAVLVDDLALHTRLASGTLELRRTRLDLAELADEAVESMRPLATREGVTLRLEATASAPVEGEPAQLARVLRNLVENAIRHSPTQTEVVVDVRRDDTDIAVEVRDAGPGFAPHVRAVAFEAFTRGDEARDVRTGTAGLGLAIARGIVEAHGGHIAIVDGPGGIVRFAVPAAPRQVSEVRPVD